MNDDVLALLFDVVNQLERSLQARDCPAMIALDGEEGKLFLSDFDYLRDDAAAAAFEHRAAAHARRVRAVRWVAAVPQVWVIHEREVAVRAPSNHPLRPEEEEAITWMAFDAEDGVDYGRVPFSRRPNGDPVVGELQMFSVGVIAEAPMPGHTLLRLLMDDEKHEPGGT